MFEEADDKRLRDLLNGELSESEERQLELLIMEDPIIRSRWEQVTGSSHWPVGSAPKPEEPKSSYFSKVIDMMRSRKPGDIVEQEPSDSCLGNEEEQLRQLTQELKGFQVVREIGRGGMGVVYEAIDEALHRRVAIKVLKPLRSDDLSAENRMLSEAQSIAALQHENILAIFGVQFVLGKPVLIEQLVDGESLQKRLDREGFLPILDCISIARQITKGMAAAHALEIVHRDLKPDNVLLDSQSSTVRICDFGLALRLDTSTPNRNGFLAGTPSYMSPEQVAGGNPDPRSDLFSLGVILYVMVTGIVPFAHSDPNEVFEQLKSKIVDSACKLRKDTPLWLSKLIDRLLEKDPEKRIEHAYDVLAMLEGRNVLSKQHSFFTTKRLMLSAGVAMVVGVLSVIYGPSIFVGLKEQSHQRNLGASREEFQKRGIWIDGRNTNFSTLAQAIEFANDGEVIFLDSDIAESGIQVVGKSLSIVAWPGTKPTITHAHDESHTSRYLLRTDHDLTLRGLRIEWKPLQAIQIFEEGQLSNIISADFDTNLKVEDCEFETTQLGTILGFGGSAYISNTKFSGGLIALGCMLHGGRVEVKDCDFRCRSTLTILFPPTSRVVPDDTVIHLIDSKFEGLAAIEVFLIRRAIVGIQVKASGCRFRSENEIILTRYGNRAPDLETFAEVKEWTHRLIEWQETNCTHSLSSGFLSGRSFRQLNKMVSEFKDLKEWQEFWNQAPGGGSFVEEPQLND